MDESLAKLFSREQNEVCLEDAVQAVQEMKQFRVDIYLRHEYDEESLSWAMEHSKKLVEYIIGASYSQKNTGFLDLVVVYCEFETPEVDLALEDLLKSVISAVIASGKVSKVDLYWSKKILSGHPGRAESVHHKLLCEFFRHLNIHEDWKMIPKIWKMVVSIKLETINSAAEEVRLNYQRVFEKFLTWKPERTVSLMDTERMRSFVQPYDLATTLKQISGCKVSATTRILAVSALFDLVKENRCIEDPRIFELVYDVICPELFMLEDREEILSKIRLLVERVLCHNHAVQFTKRMASVALLCPAPGAIWLVDSVQEILLRHKQYCLGQVVGDGNSPVLGLPKLQNETVDVSRYSLYEMELLLRHSDSKVRGQAIDLSGIFDKKRQLVVKADQQRRMMERELLDIPNSHSIRFIENCARKIAKIDVRAQKMDTGMRKEREKFLNL